MRDLSPSEKAELDKVMKIINSTDDEISIIFTGRLRN